MRGDVDTYIKSLRSELAAKAPLRCCFCEKAQREVCKLIGSTTKHYICDECIGLCNQILLEEE